MGNGTIGNASRDYQTVGNQLLRAATAVSSNYRAACRGRSHAEFAAKLGVVCEEAKESSELVAIFTAGHKTATRRGRTLAQRPTEPSIRNSQ